MKHFIFISYYVFSVLYESFHLSILNFICMTSLLVIVHYSVLYVTRNHVLLCYFYFFASEGPE